MIVASEQAARAEPPTIQALVDQWEQEAERCDPLVFVVHFAADAHHIFDATITLYDSGRLSGKFPFLRWIRGDVLLRRLGQSGWQGQALRNLVALGMYKDIDASGTLLQEAFDDLAKAPPTLFVLNFADADAEAIFSAVLSGAEPPLAAILDDFSDWAGTLGHRLIVIAPRFVLALGQVERFCAKQAWAFRSGDLFTTRSGDEAWVNRVEERLRPLLCANSIALRDRVGRFVRELPAAAGLRIDRAAPEDVAVLLRLAKILSDDRFYEIAYRLEVLCRTAFEQSHLIDLDLDLETSATPGPQEQIVGFLEGVQHLPEVTRGALLAGEAGAGKTTALFQIESAWSLPRVNGSRARPAIWVPVLVEVQPGPLFRHLRSTFELSSSVRIPGAGQMALPCHALLARFATLHVLRGIFSSPILLLVDGFDGMTRASRREMERELASLRVECPDIGILIAVRKGEVSEFQDLDHAELRPLDEQQVEAMLRIHGGPDSLRDLLGTQSAPLSRYLRNPFLLAAICRVAREGANISSWNVQHILSAYVRSLGERKLTPEQFHRLVDVWLPPLAWKLSGLLSSSVKVEPAEAELAGQAAAAGILREHPDPQQIQFRHGLLMDFFAARHLAVAIRQRGVAPVVDEVLQGSDGHRASRATLMAVLAGFLTGSPLEEFIEHVRRIDCALAHACVLEASRELALAPVAGAVARELAAQISSLDPRDVRARVDVARRLDFLDPRIDVKNPANGLVDVPRMAGPQMMRYPVTNLEFAAFIDDGGYRQSAYWSAPGWEWVRSARVRHPRYWFNFDLNRPNYPVVGVCIYEALAYCRWLSARHPDLRFSLPGHDQWDFAAHGAEFSFSERLRAAAVQALEHAKKAIARGEEPSSSIKELGIEELIGEVERHMHRFEAPIALDPPYPIGVRPPHDGAVCQDLFTIWEWCDTWLREIDSRPSTTSERVEWPAIVKGGPLRARAGQVWALLGGWFDPYTRFHELGFRMCATRTTRSRKWFKARRG